MRIFRLCFVMALTAVACRSGARVPGASFAGASLLAPLSEAEEAHDALLRADLGRADSVARLGYAGGLAAVFAGDVIYLRGGLPLMRGRAATVAIAAAESVGPATTVRWQPVRAEASVDGRSGFSYGYTIVSVAQAPAPAVRIDRYIAFWRHEDVGWRVTAYAETYGEAPAGITLPPAVQSAALADVPMPGTTGALEAVREADVRFSREAARAGTGEAFGRFAAMDAQIVSGPGELITGPRAITQSFGPATGGNSLVWHPVAAEVSKAGDLGFTVGNAVFTGQRADGAPQVRYSKYLTVWKKQGDGSWKYVVDGGSARPNV